MSFGNISDSMDCSLIGIVSLLSGVDRKPDSFYVEEESLTLRSALQLELDTLMIIIKLNQMMAMFLDCSIGKKMMY